MTLMQMRKGGSFPYKSETDVKMTWRKLTRIKSNDIAFLDAALCE
jgi:hypothetical protein